MTPTSRYTPSESHILLLRNVNRVNHNHLQLKQLIPQQITILIMVLTKGPLFGRLTLLNKNISMDEICFCILKLPNLNAQLQ